MRRPLSMALSHAIAEALPAIISERDATDGVPSGTSSLSPSISLTSPTSMPSRFATTRGKRREMPLSHRLHAEADGDLAVASNRRSAFSLRMPPATSRKQHMPDAAQLSGFARCRAPPGEAVPVGERQRLVHDGFELAAVVDRSVRRLVRHRVGRDEVAPAQLDPIDAHLARGAVDQAFRSGRSPRGGPRRDRDRAAPRWSARS